MNTNALYFEEYALLTKVNGGGVNALYLSVIKAQIVQ